MLMKPPMKGANSGPTNTVIANMVIARPRSLLLYMSANTAPTTVSGQAPENPAKKRQINTVWASFPTATAMLNMLNVKDEMTMGHFLP
jgi:hypothetical protein